TSETVEVTTRQSFYVGRRLRVIRERGSLIEDRRIITVIQVSDDIWKRRRTSLKRHYLVRRPFTRELLQKSTRIGELHYAPHLFGGQARGLHRCDNRLAQSLTLPREIKFGSVLSKSL